jgi:hypothetical protein
MTAVTSAEMGEVGKIWGSHKGDFILFKEHKWPCYLCNSNFISFSLPSGV